MVLRSLKGKLFVAVLLLGVLPFSLSVAVEAYLARQRLMAEAHDRLAATPLSVLRRIEALLFARWNDVHLLSHMPLLQSPDGTSYQKAILRRATEVYGPYAWIALSDGKGRIVATSDEKLVNTDASRSRWFREAGKISLAMWQEAARSIYISEPYVPTADEKLPVMCFNSPVYDIQGSFSGVVHSEVRLAILLPYLSSLQLGETQRVLLIGEDGKVLLDAQGRLPPLRVSVAGHRLFGRAASGDPVVARDRDIDGDAALVGMFPMKGFGNYPGIRWTLYVSQKESEILAPVRPMLYFHASLGIVGAGVILLGGFVLVDRRISRPVTQLIDRVRVLRAQGPVAEESPETYSADEIGQLGRAFGEMVESLVHKEKARKELQEQLIHKERLAVIGEMVAGVAHQIKNPLATIKVVSQRLNEELGPDAPSHVALSRIDTEVNRLNRLLQAFFDFAAPRDPQRSACDLRALVQEALSRVEEEIKRAGVRVVETYAEDFPLLFVDVQQMLQVFVNLFHNAVLAMPEGGTLAVRAEVSGEKEKGVPWAEVEVSDTGVGISPEDLPKIFQPFFTTRPLGTGLGLSLAHKVVQRNGGDLRADSQPGRGTTFVVLLPGMARNQSGRV